MKMSELKVGQEYAERKYQWSKVRHLRVTNVRVPREYWSPKFETYKVRNDNVECQVLDGDGLSRGSIRTLARRIFQPWDKYTVDKALADKRRADERAKRLAEAEAKKVKLSRFAKEFAKYGCEGDAVAFSYGNADKVIIPTEWLEKLLAQMGANLSGLTKDNTEVIICPECDQERHAYDFGADDFICRECRERAS